MVKAIPDTSKRAQVFRELVSRPLAYAVVQTQKVVNEKDIGIVPLLPLLHLLSQNYARFHNLATVWFVATLNDPKKKMKKVYGGLNFWKTDKFLFGKKNIEFLLKKNRKKNLTKILIFSWKLKTMTKVL